MDRLTWSDCNDGVYAQDIIQEDYDGATVFTGEPIDRLAAYEETGLMPEEIEAMQSRSAELEIRIENLRIELKRIRKEGLV